jgi:hypothetical protein
LKQHPDIYLPKYKELHYFTNTKKHGKSLRRYERYYSTYSGEKIAMEATPGYLCEESTLLEIKNRLGSDLKLIIIIREPIARLKSHYRMLYSFQHERKPLNLRIRECMESDTKDYRNYIRRGLYYDQIKLLEKYFDSNNIHLMVFEKFLEDIDSHMARVARFLGIDESFKFTIEGDRNEGRRNRVNFLGAVFYQVPIMWREFLFKVIPKNIQKTISSKLMKENNLIEIEEITDENLKLLNKIYSGQIEKLEAEYNLDLNCWRSQ